MKSRVLMVGENAHPLSLLARALSSTPSPDDPGMDPEEDAMWAAHFERSTKLWKIGEEAGLDFVKGCQCCGGNTPELQGNCPCRGIDVRSPEVKAQMDEIEKMVS